MLKLKLSCLLFTHLVIKSIRFRDRLEAMGVCVGRLSAYWSPVFESRSYRLTFGSVVTKDINNEELEGKKSK